MNNKEFYKDTFNEVHVPAAVLGKVRDMKMEKTTIKRQSRLRYAVSVVAVLAVCLIASNGICYAATGDTWIQKVTFYVNGEKQELDMTMHKEGDTLIGEVTREIDGKESYMIITGSDTSESDQVMITDSADKETSLVSEDDKIYLVIGDNLKRIDITEDFADGKCSGTVELEGVTYNYEVTGTLEDNSIRLDCVSND